MSNMNSVEYVVSTVYLLDKVQTYVADYTILLWPWQRIENSKLYCHSINR